MKPLRFLLLLVVALPANGQNYYPSGMRSTETVSIYGGITGFLGDLEGTSSYINTNPHLGVSYEYQLSRRFSGRAYGLWYQISAKDANSNKESLVNRNLSFTSSNLEIGAMLAAYVLRQSKPNGFASRRPFNLYVLFGLGLTRYNPKTTYQGSANGDEMQEYDLRDYKTEGVEYGKWSLVLPVGGGLVVKLSDRIDLAGEIKLHYAFTDYLDDCSARYLTEEQYNGDDLRKALADRRLVGEASGQRGNPTINDSYATYSIKAGYRLLRYKYQAEDLHKRLRKRYK